MNQVLRLPILKTILRRKKRRIKHNKQTKTIAILSRNRNTGCNKWQITNHCTASRKEHKYSTYCQPSKRCGKK